MIKFSAVILFLSFINSSDAQSVDYCSMLKQIFIHGKTKRRFGLTFDNFGRNPIIFVDTKHLFDGCKMKPYKGREVEFVNDSLYLLMKGNQYIIIHDIIETNAKYYIIIEHKSSGEYGDIEFIDSNKGKIISNVNIGAF
jgi:hypothetical protein